MKGREVEIWGGRRNRAAVEPDGEGHAVPSSRGRKDRVDISDGEAGAGPAGERAAAGSAGFHQQTF